ncbi:MAG: hypothetical protein CMQ14_12830 [Gammaproteobacteria bacterium]|jgi:TRAP-type C4-dicarboxylate transport system permease small subunit|nr:hypothetical protein [Gammaproteobacteria bacterium]|tara:strand:- start:1548 stop:2021 length:474 start_codon:yes stop_codon:yes gene_type:complete
MKKTDQARKAWSVVQKALTACAVIVLFAMMLLTSFDVVARYVFNSPVRGAFELTEIGLAILVFLALPVATATGSHIAVDLMPLPKSPVWRKTLGLFVKAVIAMTFALIAWKIWTHAGKLASYGQVTNSLEISVGMVAYIVAVGAAVSAVSAFASKEF